MPPPAAARCCRGRIGNFRKDVRSSRAQPLHRQGARTLGMALHLPDRRTGCVHPAARGRGVSQVFLGALARHVNRSRLATVTGTIGPAMQDFAGKPRHIKRALQYPGLIRPARGHWPFAPTKNHNTSDRTSKRLMGLFLPRQGNLSNADGQVYSSKRVFRGRGHVSSSRTRRIGFFYLQCLPNTTLCDFW